MPALSEEALLQLAEYLATHKPLPVRGGGTVRLEFQANPVDRPAALEPLFHDRAGRSWYVRWPNGTLRWVTESFLEARGFPVPTAPLVAEIE
jgi:hypothetical protein